MRNDDALGLFHADDFDVVPGRDAARIAGRHAAWYFAQEWVGVAREGRKVAGFGAGMRPFHDLRRWNEANAKALPPVFPPLIWLGGNATLRRARVDRDLSRIEYANHAQRLILAPRLASNRSWLDGASGDWLAREPLLVRGIRRGETFEARVLFPETFTLGPAPPPLLDHRFDAVPLSERVREPADAYAPYSASTLWQRSDESWHGRTVVAFIVNGSQGDDDESHAGHFSVATGRIADDGSIGGWLVNSLYALDTVSEKGILPAPTPLANFQADVNAGQSWYRPTWMLVAILDGERAARRVQQGFDRLHRQFWRHQVRYDHATSNCTSLSLDTLDALGFTVPARGPTSPLAARAGFPMLLARERSIAKARTRFDYLVVDRTRLLPMVALDAIGERLFRIAQHPQSASGILEREIAQELCALAWLRVPQLPSARAPGSFAVASLAEYDARVPGDRSKRKIVPLEPRSFPDALRDDDLLPPLPRPSDLAVRAWTIGPLALIALVLVLAG